MHEYEMYGLNNKVKLLFRMEWAFTGRILFLANGILRFTSLLNVSIIISKLRGIEVLD